MPDSVRRMVRPAAQLRCPSCETVGQYEVLSDRHPKTLVREYRCKHCEHIYKTEEVVAEGDPDAFVVTPRTPHPVRFNASLLETHLETHLKKLLTAEQRHGVVVRTSSLFPRRLPRLKRLEVAAEHAARVGNAPVLPGSQVRAVVLEALKDETRRQTSPDLKRRYQSAAAMYQLTQVDIELQPFAGWLLSYFELGLNPPRAGSAARGEVWVPPPRAAQLPRIVVKNRIAQDEQYVEGEATAPQDRAERRSRDHVEFRRERLTASVAAAVGGVSHQQAVSPAELTDHIVEWVLWCCDGQPVVRSSQLAAYAAGALRRAAPVAYLRWVTLGKELRPDELFDETKALISRPAPRLWFKSPAAPGLNVPPRL